jgi:hypothetical protein
MALVEVDPLAVLPVRAATASAAFARACDPHRDPSERREQLRLLELTLISIRELLNRGEQETARLAQHMSGSSCATHCSSTLRGCLLSISRAVPGGEDDEQHCVRPRDDQGDVACGEPAVAILRDKGWKLRSLCLAHAAAAAREGDQLAIVAASRLTRAALAEVAGESCIVRRRIGRPTDAGKRVRSA